MPRRTHLEKIVIAGAGVLVTELAHELADAIPNWLAHFLEATLARAFELMSGSLVVPLAVVNAVLAAYCCLELASRHPLSLTCWAAFRLSYYLIFLLGVLVTQDVVPHGSWQRAGELLYFAMSTSAVFYAWSSPARGAGFNSFLAVTVFAGLAGLGMMLFDTPGRSVLVANSTYGALAALALWWRVQLPTPAALGLLCYALSLVMRPAVIDGRSIPSLVAYLVLMSSSAFILATPPPRKREESTLVPRAASVPRSRRRRKATVQPSTPNGQCS